MPPALFLPPSTLPLPATFYDVEPQDAMEFPLVQAAAFSAVRACTARAHVPGAPAYNSSIRQSDASRQVVAALPIALRLLHDARRSYSRLSPLVAYYAKLTARASGHWRFSIDF